MDQLPDAKQLKKLADACRKAGIKTFKGYGLEFTLSDIEPATKSSKKKAAQTSDSLESEELTDEQIMFWSAPSIPQQGEQ